MKGADARPQGGWPLMTQLSVRPACRGAEAVRKVIHPRLSWIFSNTFQMHIRRVIFTLMGKINEWTLPRQAPHVWLEELGSSESTIPTNDNM
ncbi:hypothetical protein BOP96_21545 [Pseudomonas sp. FSL W5-0203]|nr:hypothetical protein BOP96_21545 [Pseudomonas sp. FSL W5-0203]